ncbi:MAG: hypothetical protein ACR2RF_12705, partial [Geminicoccaceae bacterium]
MRGLKAALVIARIADDVSSAENRPKLSPANASDQERQSERRNYSRDFLFFGMLEGEDTVSADEGTHHRCRLNATLDSVFADL